MTTAQLRPTVTSKFTLLGRLSSIFHLMMSSSLLLLLGMALPSVGRTLATLRDRRADALALVKSIHVTFAAQSLVCRANIGGVTFRTQLEEKLLGVDDFTLFRLFLCGKDNERECVCVCVCVAFACSSSMCQRKITVHMTTHSV